MVTDIAAGLGGLMLRAFIVLMPVLILLEWVRSHGWFRKLIEGTRPLFRPVGFEPQSLFPLLTGLLFGISYGAGVLIPQARSGDLDRRQVLLIGAFLGISHAVFEDTLLFVVVGGNGWIMVTSRFVTAILVVSLLARLLRPAPVADPLRGE